MIIKYTDCKEPIGLRKYREFSQNKDTLYLIYNEQGVCIGIGNIRPKLNIFHLIKGGHLDLLVFEEYRGQNLSLYCLYQLFSKCRELNLTKILITCKSNHKWTKAQVVALGSKRVLKLFGREYHILQIPDELIII